MTAVKKTAAVLLTFIMLFSLSSCGVKDSKTKTEATTEFDGKTVVDQAGRTVKIPKGAKTVATVYGVSTNYILALGKGGDIVAVNASWTFLNDIQPSLKTVKSVGRGTVDYEALAEVSPDIFIGKASDTETLEAVSKMGIAAIGIAPESIDGIYETITLLGEALDAQTRADELIAYYKSKVELADSIVQKIPENKRKTAIVMGSQLGKVAGGDMLQSAMIETAGGISSAKNIKNSTNWALVGTETVFKWNPDFIFCTNSSSSEYTVEEVMKDSSWSNLTAVKNKQVLLVPSEKDSWEFPGLSSMLGILWMLSQMYPDYYSEADFSKEVTACYQFLYGKSFDRAYLSY